MTDTPEFEELVERVYRRVSQSTINEYITLGLSRDETIDQLDKLFKERFFDRPGIRGGDVNPFGVVSRQVARVVVDKELGSFFETRAAPELIPEPIELGGVDVVPVQEDAFTRTPRARAASAVSKIRMERPVIERPASRPPLTIAERKKSTPIPTTGDKLAQTRAIPGYKAGEGSSRRLYKRLWGGK